MEETKNENKTDKKVTTTIFKITNKNNKKEYIGFTTDTYLPSRLYKYHKAASRCHTKNEMYKDMLGTDFKDWDIVALKTDSMTNREKFQVLQHYRREYTPAYNVRKITRVVNGAISKTDYAKKYAELTTYCASCQKHYTKKNNKRHLESTYHQKRAGGKPPTKEEIEKKANSTDIDAKNKLLDALKD